MDTENNVNDYLISMQHQITRCLWKDEAMAYFKAFFQGHYIPRGHRILLETYQNIYCHK